MVVEIRPEDLSDNSLFTEELKTKSEELKATNKNNGQWTTGHCPLTMMYFQEALEATCWQQGYAPNRTLTTNDGLHPQKTKL